MRLFTPLAGTYELINHILTFGLDMLWRRYAVRKAVQGGGNRWLDLCTGTGETASALVSQNERARVFALDANAAMLDYAKKKRLCKSVRFFQGDVYSLPFRDGAFDLVTISFAVRTLSTRPEQLARVFREVHRVINPGGRFVMVDTSQPANSVFKSLFHQYVRMLVKPVGSMISGDRHGYAFLAHTILRFPGVESIAEILEKSGFVDISFQQYCFGAAAVHVASASESGDT